MADRYSKSDEEFRLARVGGPGALGPPEAFVSVSTDEMERQARLRAAREEMITIENPALIRVMEKGGYKKGMTAMVGVTDGMGTVHVEWCVCDSESEHAIRVHSRAWKGHAWFPRKMIRAESSVKKKGDEGTMAITYWIAKKKGLVDREGAAPPPPAPTPGPYIAATPAGPPFVWADLVKKD